MKSDIVRPSRTSKADEAIDIFKASQGLRTIEHTALKEQTNQRLENSPAIKGKNKTTKRAAKNQLLHDATSSSVARSSLMLGAVVLGLVANIVVWLFAKYSGYSYSPSLTILTLIIGATLGLLVEFLLAIFRRKSKHY